VRGALWRVTLVGWSAVVFGTLLLHAIRPLPGHDAREWAAGLLAFPVASALLLLRRPHNRIGQLLGVVSAAAGGIFLSMWMIVVHPRPWSDTFDALVSPLAIVHFWAVISLLYLFPTGRPADRVSRRLFVAFTAWAGVMVVWTPFAPGPLSVFNDRPNPLALGPDWLAQVHDAAFFGLVVGVVGGLVAVRRRRRLAGPVERAQLKWFTSAATLMVVLVFVIGFVPEGGAGGWVDSGGIVIAMAAFWSLPAAIVTAVLRYRLYDIDRLVSRGVTYGAVLAMLGGVYALAVFLLSSLLPRSGDLAVAGSTLAAAALFDPLRRRVQRTVSRRFDRTRYDAEAEMRRFVEHLRNEVDLDGLTGGLVDVVASTMHPASVKVWVPPRAPASGQR
jgi:hypothetical protein